jgi:GTP-binding protein
MIKWNKNIEFLKSSFSKNDLLKTKMPEIAFAGRSNVGKSSLINKIINRKSFVKTSSKPGKTVAINYFSLDDSIHLVDLPGYGYAKVSKKMKHYWGELITHYLESSTKLSCLVLIVDSRRSFQAEELEFIEWLLQNNINFIIVFNKIDKLKANEFAKLKKSVKNICEEEFPNSKLIESIFWASAVKGQGIDKIKLALEGFVN